MSTLSYQVNSLRLMARLVREYDYKEISRMLREAADTIEALSDKLQGVMGTRYCELFGTPERAARTLYYDKEPICAGCALLDECAKELDEGHDTCLLVDYDALLEWMKGRQ